MRKELLEKLESFKINDDCTELTEFVKSNEYNDLSSDEKYDVLNILSEKSVDENSALELEKFLEEVSNFYKSRVNHFFRGIATT